MKMADPVKGLLLSASPRGILDWAVIPIRLVAHEQVAERHGWPARPE